MPDVSIDSYYSDLPLYRLSAQELIAREELFQRVPASWHVVVTDIRGSTQAVAAGQHQLVNLVASGSIIATLNIGRKAGLSIPFFFGGDGAILLVPPALLREIMQALGEHRDNSLRNYGLYLRVGQMEVREIYVASRKLVLAKMCLGKDFAVPVVLGNGLKYAEQVIKARQATPAPKPDPSYILDLEGMECRWDQIRPPKSSFEVVCLLVEALEEEHQSQVFSEVLKTLQKIYGSREGRNPISIPQLKLKVTPARIAREMRIKLGRFRWTYLFQNFLKTAFGLIYFRFFSSGRRYLKQLVELSDTLVLDGRINTVISGGAAQRQRLVRALDDLEREGRIRYGYYVCTRSVMTCYVRNRNNQHIHFVDGSEGGYTQAARMLKKKRQDAEA